MPLARKELLVNKNLLQVSCKYHSGSVPPKSHNTLYQTYLQSCWKSSLGRDFLNSKGFGLLMLQGFVKTPVLCWGSDLQVAILKLKGLLTNLKIKHMLKHFVREPGRWPCACKKEDVPGCSAVVLLCDSCSRGPQRWMKELWSPRRFSKQ